MCVIELLQCVPRSYKTWIALFLEIIHMYIYLYMSEKKSTQLYLFVESPQHKKQCHLLIKISFSFLYEVNIVLCYEMHHRQDLS